MTELQSNTRNNLLNTLQFFSSLEEQINYKNAVPYVHIPNELLSQWESYRELRNKTWYIEIWNSREIKAIDDFEIGLKKQISKMNMINDLPKILEDRYWLEIKKIAQLCLANIITL